MDKLQVGDTVRVKGDTFSEVFMFSHADPTAKSRFVRLTTENGKILALSPTHFLYLDGELRPAKEARPGHAVYDAVDGNTTRVSSIEMISSRGLYNPHTMHGDIAVNGIVTSTWTQAVSPQVARALLTPVRALYRRGLPTRVFNMPYGGGALLRALSWCKRIVEVVRVAGTQPASST